MILTSVFVPHPLATQALKFGPPDCLARENMAVVLTDLGTRLKMAGSLDDALDKYARAIELQPSYAPAHFNSGVNSEHISIPPPTPTPFSFRHTLVCLQASIDVHIL